MESSSHLDELQGRIAPLTDTIKQLKNQIAKISDEFGDICSEINHAKAIDNIFKRLADLSMGGYTADELHLIDALRHRLNLYQLRSDALSAIAACDKLVLAKNLGREQLPAKMAAERISEGVHLEDSEKILLRDFVTEWNLIDYKWYGLRYLGDKDAEPAAVLNHFLTDGAERRCDPNPIFSNLYIEITSRQEPRALPILSLAKNSLAADPFPIFDSNFYSSKYPDIANAKIHPYLHYIKYGSEEGRQPHVAFDPRYYHQKRKPDNPRHLLKDYITNPLSYHIDPHPLFASNHYLRQMAECSSETFNPLFHYLVWGEKLGFSPHPLFEPSFYLGRNYDLLEANVAPLKHFLTYGDRELRQPHPLFEPAYYVDSAKEHFGTIEQPLLHYVTEGSRQRTQCSTSIDLKGLIDNLRETPTQAPEPIEAIMNGVDLSPSFDPESIMRSRGQRAFIESRDRDHLINSLIRNISKSYAEADVEKIQRLMEVLYPTPGGDLESDAADVAQGLLKRIRELAAEPPQDKRLVLSIVIPVHNQLIYTLVCITAILIWKPSQPFEILIGDDHSNKDDYGVLSSIATNIRVLRHSSNLGFVKNCNLTASHSNASFLLFLNNDTLPLPGAIDALLALATKDSQIGLVGSKLLNSDGTLQEAGAIYWNDGSAWNFGRGADPHAAPYNYVKEADYISGAAILVNASVWRRIGGFDETFAPAYCEDSDLAFKIRSAGLKCLYNPFSEIIHHEGKSHGTDISTGIKKYQSVNMKKFKARWGLTLLRENLPVGQHVFVARDRSRDRPHVLIVDHYIPQWDRDAGSRTMFDFIKLFVKQGLQVVFWSDNLNYDPEYAKPLQRLGVEVIYGAEFSGRFEDWYRQRAVWIPYVLLSRPHISIKYIEIIKRLSSSKIFYYAHDLHWLRLEQEGKVTGRKDIQAEIDRVKKEEYSLFSQSDLVIFPSEEERSIVFADFSGQKPVISVPAWFFEEGELELKSKKVLASEPRDVTRLLFVGGFMHGPNVDAVLWFVMEILPILDAAGFKYEFVIAGSNPPKSVTDLARDTIRVVGRISDNDLNAYYESSTFSVVPLRFGGGVKGKVIEAFARGVSVISTSVGMQGIANHDSIAFVADEPEGFAARIISGAMDDSIRLAKIKSAFEFVSGHYTDACFVKKLEAFMPEIAANRFDQLRLS